MQAGVIQSPLYLAPPITLFNTIGLGLIVSGSVIEMLPDEYEKYITNPLVIICGMFISAGCAAVNEIPLAFAVAFFLVNILRIIPKKVYNNKVVAPGVKEGFNPAGTIDWVTTHKKWFVEKVLKEKPIAIQEKEVATYPVQA
jgi:hypothetical protein